MERHPRGNPSLPEGESSRDRANTMYWDTDLGVNQIADELGVSKGSLYELIDPTATGSECTICGSPLEYVNRTARDRDEARCPVCEGEETLDSERPDSDRTEAREGASTTLSRRPEMVGAALVGVAVGLAIGALMGRR